MAHLYFILTRGCPLHCPHCYLDAGPDKYEDTMSVADFGKCVDNFPKGGLNSITLSGGEVFSLEERLYDYLDIIKDKIPDYKLVLQTSGYWAVDNKTTKDSTKLWYKILGGITAIGAIITSLIAMGIGSYTVQ